MSIRRLRQRAIAAVRPSSESARKDAGSALGWVRLALSTDRLSEPELRQLRWAEFHLIKVDECLTDVIVSASKQPADNAHTDGASRVVRFHLAGHHPDGTPLVRVDDPLTGGSTETADREPTDPAHSQSSSTDPTGGPR